MKQNIGLYSKIDDDVKLFYKSNDDKKNLKPTLIGYNCIIRSGTVIYCDVIIGDDFQSGHNVLIRESTRIGNRVLVGTSTIIDGGCDIGDDTKIQSGVYIPTGTCIGSNVFIGPKTTFTNDMYPPLRRGYLDPVYVGDNVVIGANVTILPGVIIGNGSFIAAGSLVTKHVPENMMAIGSPARFKNLPEL